MNFPSAISLSFPLPDHLVSKMALPQTCNSDILSPSFRHNLDGFIWAHHFSYRLRFQFITPLVPLTFAEETELTALRHYQSPSLQHLHNSNNSFSIIDRYIRIPINWINQVNLDDQEPICPTLAPIMKFLCGRKRNAMLCIHKDTDLTRITTNENHAQRVRPCQIIPDAMEEELGSAKSTNRFKQLMSSKAPLRWVHDAFLKIRLRRVTCFNAIEEPIDDSEQPGD